MVEIVWLMVLYAFIMSRLGLEFRVSFCTIQSNNFQHFVDLDASYDPWQPVPAKHRSINFGDIDPDIDFHHYLYYSILYTAVPFRHPSRALLNQSCVLRRVERSVPSLLASPNMAGIVPLFAVGDLIDKKWRVTARQELVWVLALHGSTRGDWRDGGLRGTYVCNVLG